MSSPSVIALVLKVAIGEQHLALRAYHADVAGVGLHRPFENDLVVRVPPGDDGQVVGLIDGDFLEDFREILPTKNDSAIGKRSLLANEGLSSTTETRKPAR